jgi:hypothetical protein
MGDIFPLISSRASICRRKGNTSNRAADSKRSNGNYATYGNQRRRSEAFVVRDHHPRRGLNITTGNQWRQDLRKWLSSPDPSTNHIISCGAQHEGTAMWFFRGSLFEEWKSTGSLLWIHGKRMSPNHSLFHSNETCLCSGRREECSLVRCFSCVVFSGA